MRDHSFARKEHLKKDGLIKQVFDRGIPSRGRLITIHLLKRETGSCTNRAAFIIRKNLYNKKAVLRNRLRRLLREAYRNTKHFLPGGHDILILATNVRKNTRSQELEKDIANVFKKCVKK